MKQTLKIILKKTEEMETEDTNGSFYSCKYCKLLKSKNML